MITKQGIVDLYLLLFLHIDTREVSVTSATAHPDLARVAQQARNFLVHFTEWKDQQTHPNHLVREFVAYHNDERSHSYRNHLSPCCAEQPEEDNSVELGSIDCRERLGGLIKTFQRKAA